MHLYFDRFFVNDVALIPDYFPVSMSDKLMRNRIISITGRGSTKKFSVLISNTIPDLEMISKAQCFPLYHNNTDGMFEDDLFQSDASGDTHRQDAISDFGLSHFQGEYPSQGDSITKEDLFYYIYGLLHSPEYRERYKENLTKELPRIPAVKKFEDFQAFSQAGRDLAHWHLDYETVKCHPVTPEFTGGPTSFETCKDEHFYVKKMKFAKAKDPETGKRVNDKTTVIYNEYITVKDIPLEAYDYVVNGKPAIEWVMERQAVTTDKKSGIVNDANLWATETMENAAYPLELLMRVITVSLETNKIVESLPALDID